MITAREVTVRLHTELGVRPGPLLRAAIVEARGPGGAAFPGAPAQARPLFGRAAELRTLMTAWTAARAGHGRVVLITGEAGIGKTRLVAELARRADNAGARTAVGAGVDVGGEAPLAIWQELVPQLARVVPVPPEQAEAVLRLVEWAASGRPVLLVAEDVHRADPAATNSWRWPSRRPLDHQTRLPRRWPAICTVQAVTTWPDPGGSGRRGGPDRWAPCPRRRGSGPRRCAAIQRR
jgi:hypothetical protein